MYLRNAALRAASIRTAALQTPLRRSARPTYLRSYANFVRNGKSNNSRSPGQERPSSLAELKLNEERKKAFAREQAGLEPDSYEEVMKDAEQIPELDSAASPHENTVPDLQPGPGAPQSTINPSALKESDKYQEEFEGPKSADANMASGPESSELPGGKPLPDLRQGIPSTFAEEFGKIHEKEAERRDPKTVEEAERANEEARQQGDHEFAGSGRGGGELPKSAYETSTDRRRNRVANWGFGALALFGASGAIWLGRDWDSDEEARRHSDIPSGWGLGIFWDRIQARLGDSLGYYTEPTFPKLLPIMDQMPPYTLVISLEDMMVHSDWSRQHGYRTAKRPGIDYFLRYLSQYYEIVMFTSLPMAQAEPVYRKLDPYHIIMWPLFREATRYHKGEYVKVRMLTHLHCSLLTSCQPTGHCLSQS